MNFLDRLLKRSPRPPRMLDVGELDVTITFLDGTKRELPIIGWWYPSSFGDMIYDADYLFRDLVRDWGRIGTVPVKDGYVPMERVKSIIASPVREHMKAALK